MAEDWDALNLNPTPEAIAALAIWGNEYGRQNKGCMEWFYGLSDGRKFTAMHISDRIIESASKHGRIHSP